MAVFRKVAIIDDDDLFLTLSEYIMADLRFANEVLKFKYADKALAYIKSADSSDLPEVLFLDINMPYMDAWEFMDALDGVSVQGKMAIYISSSSIDPKDLEKAEKNPLIKGFVSKPFEPSKLRKIKEEYRR